MMKLVFTATLTALITICGFGQEITDGWEGIKPFKSTRADVEKAVGHGAKETEEFRATFETTDAIVHVLFSGEPCSNGKSKTPRLARAYDIPRDTVIHYTVNFKKGRLFTDLGLDKNQFRRVVNSGLPQFVVYTSGDGTITITAFALPDGTEHVGIIHFGVPTENGRNKFACKGKKGRDSSRPLLIITN